MIKRRIIKKNTKTFPKIGHKEHKEKEIPFSSVSQCRSDIFFAPYLKLPTNFRGKKSVKEVKINNKEVIIEKYFTILTEKHRDVLIACLLSASKKALRKDDGYAILFSLRQVLKKLKLNKNNQAWLIEKLKELRFAPFTAIDKEDKKKQYPFTILSELKPSKILNENIDGGFMKDKTYYYYAEISKEYIEFMRYDIQIYINTYILESIIELKNAETKALAWYCLSQNKLNKDIENVLLELGVLSDKTSKQMKRLKLKNIKEECQNLKDKFGIEIKKMQTERLGIFYEKHKSVYFLNNKKEIKFIDLKDERKEQIFTNLIEEIG